MILLSHIRFFVTFVLSFITSGVTDGGKGASHPPWQAKCKNWGPLILIILWDFSWLLFFCISLAIQTTALTIIS